MEDEDAEDSDAMVTIEPRPPSTASPSFSKTSAHRRLTPKKKETASTTTQSASTGKKNTKTAKNMAELTRLLDADAQRLGNMKNDINDIQNREIEKAQRELANTKRDYDSLLSYNQMKKSQIEEFRIRTSTLKNVEDAVVSTKREADMKMKDLESQLDQVKSLYEMEQRTANMLHHMYSTQH